MNLNMVQAAAYLGLSQNCRILIFGKDGGNWALGLNETPDFLPHSEVIGEFFPEQSVQDIYCPNCRMFNAKLVRPEDFDRHQQSDGGHRFHWGPKAAGMEIPLGAAMIIATADCPTVVIHNRNDGKIVAAHAGLNELIDRDKIHHKTSVRYNGSVIDAMIRSFAGKNTDQLECYIVCGIRVGDFKHRVKDQLWGKRNSELITYLRKCYPKNGGIVNSSRSGHINLYELISVQLESFGISRKRIHWDTLSTFKNPNLWSNRRESQTLGGNPNGRNMILITNW